MKIVYIAHPFHGTCGRDSLKDNFDDVKLICCKIIKSKPEVLPLSPVHVFSFLDARDEKENEKALDLCERLIPLCDEVWFFDSSPWVRGGVTWMESRGCIKEHRAALSRGVPVCNGREMLDYE